MIPNPNFIGTLGPAFRRLILCQAIEKKGANKRIKPAFTDWNTEAGISQRKKFRFTFLSVNKFIELPACSKIDQKTSERAVRNIATKTRSRSVRSHRKMA